MDRKNKIKAGLIFGILMTLFFIFQDLLTQDNPTIKSIIITIVSSLFGGALSAVLFGWLVGLLNSQLGKSININTNEKEIVIFETAASHFKGLEAVGGKLYLTNERLVFKSHKINIQKHELSIHLSDINKVYRYKILGIFNNGPEVAANANMIEKFSVQKPEEWINQLRAIMSYSMHNSSLI
ncbi:MAG TPA: GRAM domain-containing protein [Hanamia sp.]|nr:GRAM domain-containing protein [Hanamia sp.]